MVLAAQYGILLIMGLFLVLHFCVLLKIVPYTMVWGGRLKSDKEMYQFEIISIIMTILIIGFFLIQANILSIEIPNLIETIILWSLTILFLLNTLGNFQSKNKLEKIIFTPTTLVLAILCLSLAIAN